MTKRTVRRNLNAGIRSLQLSIPYLSGANELNSLRPLQIRTLPGG
ncbi:MAG: hypothetical protein ACREBG_03625 [Pyrinomonadaceae bacterium]